MFVSMLDSRRACISSCVNAGPHRNLTCISSCVNVCFHAGLPRSLYIQCECLFPCWTPTELVYYLVPNINNNNKTIPIAPYISSEAKGKGAVHELKDLTAVIQLFVKIGVELVFKYLHR